MTENQFGLISEIDFYNPSSWQKKYFITLDIDWAVDEVIRFTANLLNNNNIKATWFATHETPILNELRNNPLFELGIHPNFNKILNGNFENGKNINEIFELMLKIVPEAKSFRSHSLTQNTPIINTAANNGIQYDLNTFIPITSGIRVEPFKHTSAIFQLPHIWEDDVHYINSWNYQNILNTIKNYEGLKILDFHPIHIFLNTEKEERYLNSRSLHKIPQELIKHQNHNFGTTSFLLKLLENH